MGEKGAKGDGRRKGGRDVRRARKRESGEQANKRRGRTGEEKVRKRKCERVFERERVGERVSARE